MTRDHAPFSVRFCELGHVHVHFGAAELQFTPEQARQLAADLNTQAVGAETVHRNIPGIVGGDAPACA